MPKKKPVSQKTKPKPTLKTKTETETLPKTESKKERAKEVKKQVNKDINVQINKGGSVQENRGVDIQAKQTYLFPTKETDLGPFHLDSLDQKKSKDAKDIDLKEAWYCPSKELHDAFRFYSFQNNMKKSNIITKAIVEMLEREGFLKKS